MNHDAAMSVVDYSSGIGEVLWAAHAERYSKVKNDHYLNWQIVNEAMTYGPFDKVVYYEKPWLKKTRQLYAGQWSDALSYTELPQWHLDNFNIKIDEYVKHHDSHAAAGYFTSPFREATILTVDAIGEWDTVSISTAEKIWIERKETIKYPHSIGILYSAFTHRCGLKPAEEEYILMGMAAYGQPKYVRQIKDELIESMYPLKLKVNPHIGLSEFLNDADPIDLAASIQEIANEFIVGYVSQAVVDTGITKVIYQGGVALNCVTNTKLLEVCEEVWIMPNPGDAGNSLGAACLQYGKPVEWESPYLGTNIEGEYPVDKIVQELLQNKICGVANGRAEFGPRALGNRSLLADPRGGDIKDKVNEIKRRQKFRPFAPAILEEHLHTYFNINRDAVPYMQYVAEAKPETVEKFPAIVHFDNTARVQTVGKDDNTGFRKLLEAWYKETGCPILLNTSLNIRGEPLVNNKNDAISFNNKYNIKVFTD